MAYKYIFIYKKNPSDWQIKSIWTMCYLSDVLVSFSKYDRWPSLHPLLSANILWLVPNQSLNISEYGQETLQSINVQVLHAISNMWHVLPKFVNDRDTAFIFINIRKKWTNIHEVHEDEYFNIITLLLILGLVCFSRVPLFCGSYKYMSNAH